eukprot:118688-Pyramimonas_sp.AAC.1
MPHWNARGHALTSPSELPTTLAACLVTVTAPKNFRTETNAGQPATIVWDDDPQPTEATTSVAQHGGPPTGSQDSRARYQGPRATAAPT